MLKAGDPAFPVTHKQMPRFMYPEGHIFDPDNEIDGLFEGHFIIFVSNTILH